MSKNKVLVTGGASFIGSEFVRLLVRRGFRPVVVDALTYAGDMERLREVKGRFSFYREDICLEKKMLAIFQKEMPEQCVHFAAESHVDRSILGSREFVRTNIEGTRVLLEASRKMGVRRFVHLSTDEVYGDIERGRFFETTPLDPSSPYSASKAAADLLIGAYVRTFKFPAVIVRPSNNYGPWQYPEKFIPVVIAKAARGERIPVYGRGLNVREWLHVSDSAAGILAVLEKGRDGEAYNLGSGCERRNIDVARAILRIMKRPEGLIEFVKDRPGHDIRYSLDRKKIERQTGWKAKVDFEPGLRSTVKWYLGHRSWMEAKAKALGQYWKKVYRK